MYAIIASKLYLQTDWGTVKSNHLLVDDFRHVVTKNIPLIDLRAPAEYAKGSFPDAVNLPLLSDSEREAVGTTYKHEGSEAALKLGYEIVSGKVKEERIRSWIEYIEKHPETILFCWRGGQRSAIVQRWLSESGIEVPRLKGGYKAFRRFLAEESLRIAEKKRIVLIGGRTGSGKTLLIKELEDAIDLEGLARHRGSAFGRYAITQPPQAGFENALYYELVQHDGRGHERLILEDESRNIGRCYIPDELFGIFQKAPVALLETPLEERVEISYKDYILYAQREYTKAHEAGVSPYSWIETMRHNFDRIRKRLGNERHARLKAMLESAWEHQTLTGDPGRHKEWIEALLREYYDPMYDYQIEKKIDRVLFRGPVKELIGFLDDTAR